MCKKTCFYAAMLLGLLFTMQAEAALMGGERFDRLIEKAKIVIKAEIVPVEEDGFGNISFKAKTISILKSDGGPIPENLSLRSRNIIWPGDLGVPFEKKQVVLIVFQRLQKGEFGVMNEPRAIMPAVKTKIDHKSDGTIERKVFDELLAFLPQAKDEVSQALLLVHLSYLAFKSDDKIFLPYTKSKNKWLQRAAVASLIRVNPTDQRVRAAVADFENHLSGKPDNRPSKKFENSPFRRSEDQLFWEMYTDVSRVTSFGANGIVKKMTLKERAKTYLPIYRVLIDKAPADYQRVSAGIVALKYIGTREDVHRLYKYLNHKEEWVRHYVLEGLGRILGMKIKSPRNSYHITPQSRVYHIKQWESDSRFAVQKALIEEGLLTEDLNEPGSTLLPSNSNAVLALLFKEGTPQANDFEIKAIYSILYRRMLKEVDLDGIKKLVEQLGSDDQAVGKKALSELEKRVGLKHPVIESSGSIFPMTGTPAQVWGKYAENLKVAVNIKIPLIINNLRSSRHNSFDRYHALIYLGESCPHPAFLPILRAVALDKKEGLRMTAIRSIAAIPHQGMIDFLIDRLTAKPIGIAVNTYERLQALTGAYEQKIVIYFDVKKAWEGVDWQSTKKNYKKWWKERKDEYDFSKRLPPMQHVGGM